MFSALLLHEHSKRLGFTILAYFIIGDSLEEFFDIAVTAAILFAVLDDLQELLKLDAAVRIIRVVDREYHLLDIITFICEAEADQRLLEFFNAN